MYETWEKIWKEILVVLLLCAVNSPLVTWSWSIFVARGQAFVGQSDAIEAVVQMPVVSLLQVEFVLWTTLGRVVPEVLGHVMLNCGVRETVWHCLTVCCHCSIKMGMECDRLGSSIDVTCWATLFVCVKSLKVAHFAVWRR